MSQHAAHDDLIGRVIAPFADPRLGLGFTADELREIARAAGDADAAAIEAAIRRAIPTRHQGLLLVPANFRKHLGLGLDDLIQEGQFGLMDAARLYDPAHRSRGAPVKFSGYATRRIRAAMDEAVWNTADLIRVPYRLRWRMRAIDRGTLDPETIAPHIQGLIRLARVAQPADAGRDREANQRRMASEWIEDRGEEAPAVDRDGIRLLINTLPARIRLVVVRRFGLDGNAPVVLEEIGKEIGLTKERARQLNEEGLRLLWLAASRRGLDFDRLMSA